MLDVVMDRKTKGKKGEDMALEYLTSLGWTLKERNYRSGRSEIDLIFISPEGLLIFVEVKSRKSAHFGYPEEFVSAQQEINIKAGAQDYIEQIRWSEDIRFDIISILAGKVTHLPDAFY
jgi:putative endonuclease